MKTSSKAIVWILVVFLTGIVFGGALAFLAFQATPKTPAFWPMEDHPSRKSPEQLLHSMAESLGLDEAQREKVRTVLLESRDQHRIAARKSREEFSGIRKLTRERIRAILRPEQLERFDRFTEMRRKSRHFPRERKPD